MNNLEILIKGVSSVEKYWCDMDVSAGCLQGKRWNRSMRVQADATEVHVAVADRALAGKRMQKEARFHCLQLRLCKLS